MFPKIQENISYTHTWEFFSKLLFLSWHTIHESVVHIIGDTTLEKKFKKIAEQLWFCYLPLQNIHDIGQLSKQKNIVYSCPISRLSLKIENKYLRAFTLKVWQEITQEELLKKLLELWYEFSEYEKPWSYQKLWDIITLIYQNNEKIRISFWGDEIESLTKNSETLSSHELYSLKEFIDTTDRNTTSLKDILIENQSLCVLDALEFDIEYTDLSLALRSVSFDILPQLQNWKSHIKARISWLRISDLEWLKEVLTKWKKQKSYIYTKHWVTIEPFLSENKLWHSKIIAVNSSLFSSFRLEDTHWVTHNFICDDILWKIFIKRRSKKRISADLDLLLKIGNGDYIVHIDHGVWVFEWIIKKELWNITKEYLEITYKDWGKLYVPITEVHRVSKYVGSKNPPLTPLSGKVWEKKMKKIHEDIREIAENILKNFAERKLRVWDACLLNRELIGSFHESFPYTYTYDQADAIEAIHWDMVSDKNMDRLIVWDVGFWKTEVAFNAAYLAYLNKKQVLLISPLVVLTHEHYSSSLTRFKDLGMKIEVLTRLQSSAHANRVIKSFAAGDTDMIVGTHRLLSDKIQHKNLWLLIVDEEHKFWVVDKEKIKNLKQDIDILSLSATPIPRSLNLALSGVRDISLLKTPPSWRKSIDTTVLEFDEALILEAGKREFARGGQIFFVHNRVSNIKVMKRQLESLFPSKQVIITHWQLPWDELEDRILAFKEKKYDILLSTTVIENGIDFSNVNTIFINECQAFGISQIHQLRGRVWRSDTQWYCYLLYRKNHMGDEAAKRIQTIVDYSYLWAWFELAMKDLEIRWGWDILGVKQSGQSKEIGVSLFLKMLEEKIQELKEERDIAKKSVVKIKDRKKVRTQIDLMLTAGIPDSYFMNEVDKIHFYRELELVDSIEELEDIWKGFFSENNDTIPPESLLLLILLKVQISSWFHGIERIRKSGSYYTLEFIEQTNLDDIKNVLKKDREVKLNVISANKLRANAKEFANDGIFLEYLLRLLEWKVSNPKIKLLRSRS